MSEQAWIVHKFGGTSVADAARYRHVAALLTEGEHSAWPRQAVVVSAMSGMTDALLGLVTQAAAREAAWRDACQALVARQLTACQALLEGQALASLTQIIAQDAQDIEDLLKATWLLGSASRQTLEVISGYGELWSAQLLHAFLRSKSPADQRVQWIDARQIIVAQPATAPSASSASLTATPTLELERTQANMDRWLQEHAEATLVVITGFIASTPRGEATTLGRNGSDYSAAIISHVLRAPALIIWTDVDGVMSADPRQVPEAQVLQELSYKEAMELAYFGAKVLHPSTIAPAVSAQVVITIKNTFRPQEPGTRIHARGTSQAMVKGFATIEDVALLNLEGTTLIGVPGIAEKLFRALREAQVSVIMISQASSEHSICFVLPQAQVEAARQAVEAAFFAERMQGQIQTLEVVRGCSVLAAVGDSMAGTKGVAARFMRALAQAQVNVRAIAQGSSERNLSVVVDKDQVTRALRAAHAGFYLSDQTLSVGLIGPGGVGATLLEQLHEQAQTLREQFHLELRVRGIATRDRMLLHDQGIDLGRWRAQLEAEGQPLDLEAFERHVRADYLPHAVLIDCTASADIAARYTRWLEQGVHLVTPNKKANTGPLAIYQALRQARRHAHYLYETTVGAGLPILHTVRDLVQTGDQVLWAQGVLSGTLSYLLNSYDGATPWSALVRQAHQLGYTEPDPREDLSGMDVARKLVILARELGASLELEQVAIEGLVPEGLEQGSVEAFLDALQAHDEAMQARYEQAKARGQVLRFVGQLDAQGQASVALQALEQTHPFARIALTDNIVLFKTRRYHANPLVIQGPGAGREVTAAGVFSDLLRLASYLGAAR